MSLDWNLKRITNSDAVCWGAPAEMDDPMRGIKQGERYMTPLTDSLIWATMAVDLGSITEKNATEFYRRVSMIEAARGTFLSTWDTAQGKYVPRPITLDDVRAHIGLSTNVTNRTAKQFDAKVARMLRENAERAARRQEA